MRENEGNGAAASGTAQQEVTDLLRKWEEEHTVSTYDPIPTLTRLAEIIEVETENFMKKDPDPFDERHPSKTDPSCALGHALKVMFKKDNFMNKLVNDYVRDTYYSRLNITNRDVKKLNIAACRLTLDLMPGLEMSVVFQDNESLINRLYSWAEKSVEPLQTYATGLLAAAMEIQDIASNFREQNARLVPLMLQRLHKMRRKFLNQNAMNSESPHSTAAVANEPTRHFARFATPPSPNRPDTKDVVNRKRTRQSDSGGTSDDDRSETPVKQRPTENNFNSAGCSPIQDGMMSPPPRGVYHKYKSNTNSTLPLDSLSNSSWAEMESYVIGNVQIFPPTYATRQMLILKYLTPMGEYQEFLSHVFAENALELILGYLNFNESKDSRLAFEALKYLAALLCHKKFSIEFINMNGLQRLLEVPRPSVAATGVSICMYYLAYCEEAMERVCLFPRRVVTDLVKYTLWLLECSHDSGRCHATMFFGFSFQFRVILEEFDNQDGLRKLYNVISTLPILLFEEDVQLTEDENCAARQIVRHVCVALKRYLESHLNHKTAALRRQGWPGEPQPPLPPYKACKSSPEEIQEHIERLQTWSTHKWAPCDQLLKLGGVTLLLQIIAFSYDWNFNGRAETVRSALDVISACCVDPRAQLQLCEKVEMPDEGYTVGTNIVLSAVEGEIVADAEVQKAALKVIVNCVCAPAHRIGGTSARFSSTGSTKKKTNLKSYEDVIQKVWESVRTNNGIMVLLQLMLVKAPITDADCLRGLACRALAGLARCPTVRQIISKLPLFTTGQIQSLMRDPILQEKRQEHVMFQKYALELMERVSGKTKPTGAEFETSLANIHRANVVAQTHITYNERQLYQLIYQHLATKGLPESAEALRKELDLTPLQSSQTAPPLLPVYQPATPCRMRLHNHSRTQNLQTPDTPSTPNGYMTSDEAATPHSNTIKIRRCPSVPSSSSVIVPGMLTTMELRSTSSRLQKSHTSSPSILPPSTSPPPHVPPRITLDSIVTEYLANQHALCKNPMVTCPQFNLFEPHKCPDGLSSARIPAVNSTIRMARRQAGLYLGGGRLDKRLIHSHFCPVKTFRLAEESSFTTCIFHPTQKSILAGTSTGDVISFNLVTGDEDASHHLFPFIYHLQANKEGTLLLASSNTWRQPLSGLFDMTHYEIKMSMNDEEYVEFSKLSEDRIIGTKAEVATVYDVSTGKLLHTLRPNISNQYTKNRATFSPTDELVLSDGVLWDMNAGKEIHKFDKLNSLLSGVFHPNGLEIISNTEVWDLRTFHLLRTVPTLDKSDVIFSPLGGVIYSACMDTEESTQFESNFKTLDSYDYSSIATIDVKRNIGALSIAGWGGQLVLVENLGESENVSESIVRLYDVGRRREQDDEADEEDDDEVADNNSDNNSSSDDADPEFLDDLLDGVNMIGIEGIGLDDDDDDEDDEDDNNDDDDGDDDEDDDSDDNRDNRFRAVAGAGRGRRTAARGGRAGRRPRRGAGNRRRSNRSPSPSRRLTLRSEIRFDLLDDEPEENE